MSNLLFPKVRGLGWIITKNPTFSTEIQSSLAGREVRVQNFQNPIWEFTLAYEYLLNDPRSRDENEQTPLETLVGFFLARGGQFDDFLLNESDLTQRLEDSVFTGQPIGTGDGSTKNFQLVRNFGGFLEACQNPANQAATIYDDGTLAASRGYGLHHHQWPGAVHEWLRQRRRQSPRILPFLHRVRFDAGTSRGSSASGRAKGIEFSNFYFNLYECKEVQLISVRK